MRGAINYPALGHKVVSEAPAFGTALHIVSLMRDGYREVDAVIVPANMADGEEDGRHARILVGQLRALEVVPKIIGHANVPLAEFGVNVDADILRQEFTDDPSQLGRVLSSF
jgi:hypothetical protein